LRSAFGAASADTVLPAPDCAVIVELEPELELSDGAFVELLPVESTPAVDLLLELSEVVFSGGFVASVVCAMATPMAPAAAIVATADARNFFVSMLDSPELKMMNGKCEYRMDRMSAP